MTDGWLITIISLVGSTAVTTFIATLINRSLSKHFERVEKEELQRREHADMLLRETIRELLEPMQRDLDMIKKGTQAGLRYDLFTMADEWLAKGYCPRRIKSDFEYLYNQYHVLGKNGVMDSTYQAILALPDSLPEPKKRRRTKKSLSKEESLINI